MGNRGRRAAGHHRAPEPGDGEETAEQGVPQTGGRAERRRTARRAKRRRRLSTAKEIPILIGTAVVIALVLKTFLVQAFVIPSGSMEQTIRIGDRVLVDKFTPWFGAEPERGDVVVFEDPGGWLEGEQVPQSSPGVQQVKEVLSFIGLLPSADEQDLIKRVIGVGGDTVACCDEKGRVTVNGTALDEPYIHPGNAPSKIRFKVTVPIGRIFVMGDHRGNSADSRYHMDGPHHGTVSTDQVVGRAVVIAWPVGHWRRLREPPTFASVTDAPGAPSASGAGMGNPVRRLPMPAELPLVMGVVGLSRTRDRRQRNVRSGCGRLGRRHRGRFGRPGGRESRRPAGRERGAPDGGER